MYSRHSGVSCRPTQLGPLAGSIFAVTKTAKPGSPLAHLTTTYSYDPFFNKPTSITDPLGLVTKLSYNPTTGNLVSLVSDAGGSGHFNATVNYSYNGAGKVLTASDPMQTQTQFAYNGFGDPISVVRDRCGTTHLNQITTLTYDALGDVTSTTDPNGNATIVAPSTIGTIGTQTLIYDSLNNLTGGTWGPAAAQISSA